MQARSWMRVTALVMIGAGFDAAAIAQTAKAPPVPSTTPEWNQTVTAEPATGTGTGTEFDAVQLDLIQRLTTYFNEMGDMQGSFHQTSPDGKRLRGKIYVKRPSFFRFEYSRPSRQLIISDSKSMIIQDLDLKTDDRWSLEKTPFKVILKKDVDLLRDAKILEVGETEDRVHITLQDKSPDTVGRLKLLFQKTPDQSAPDKPPVLELKEWVTTDSQGLDTKVELVEFAKVEKLDPKLFVPPPTALQKLQQ